MPNLHLDDLDERKLALDPTKSFIVQAPAGSGKTTLLVERYLTLLNYVKHPEEIVAITFTRKAAHEMRSRIIEKLEKMQKWEIVKNPSRLRIQTIDAFCYYLVSQAPIFTKINPSFKIVQNEDAETYYRQAADEIFENLSDSSYSESLECLLLYLDNDWERTKNLLVSMLKTREQWLPHVVGLKNSYELRSKLEQALIDVTLENVERCLALFPKNLHQELVEILQASQNTEVIYEAGFFKSTITNWQGVANILLTKEFLWRKKVTKEHGFPAINPKDPVAQKQFYKELKSRMESLLATFNDHEDLRASLENILLSPPPNYSDQSWQIIESLMILLPLLAAHLKVIFNENLVTDHAEISMAALQVLGDDNPSDFALNLDYRLKHLLIDEFQDTSLSHYRLIEKLVATWQPEDGRTVFMVGDPMQSIYRFREAEVGLFLRVALNGIGDLKLQPLTLTTNFRSDQKLINWINPNFSKIFPKIADISLGAVPFRPSTAVMNFSNSKISVNLLKNSNEEMEANQIISTINNLSNEHPHDTIAILVKARSHLQKIIPALRIANLSYQGFELETLSESMVIRDLFSLTRALNNLADRVAWLAILRAPWCGLKLSDLYKVANGQNELIWDNLEQSHLLNLPQEAIVRINKLKAALLPFINQKDRINSYELIEKSWLALGGPAILNDQSELEHARVYFELLTDPLDIVTIQKKLDSLYTPPKPAAKIEIMTIHKAKGLEFDHVIIPSINRSTRFDERKLLLSFERPKLHQGSSLIIAPITGNSNKIDPVYEYLQSVEEKKSFYEAGRLLYVGMTRAKKSIHLIGNFDDSITSGSLLEQLKPCFDENWVKTPLPHFDPQKSSQNENKSGLFIRLPHDWQSPINIELPSSNHQLIFAPTDSQAAIIGTVIHRILKKLSEEEHGEIEEYIATRKPYWQKLLLEEGFLELEDGIDLITSAIKTTLSDERGRWLLLKHQEAVSELAITKQMNGKFMNYIIDRTFIDENGVRWIIDYKTSAPNDKNVKEFLAEESEKYTKQLENYTDAMAAIDPDHPIKLGLYFPMFAGWVEL